MELYKSKDIKLEELLDEIKKAEKESRRVLLSVMLETGTVIYNSNAINMKDMHLFITYADGKKVLNLCRLGDEKALPGMCIDITNDLTYHIGCGEDVILSIPPDKQGRLYKSYILCTKETNVTGIPSCRIHVKIEKY